MSYPGSQFDETTRQHLEPDNYRNPTPQPNYHLAVIGAGPAGLIAAIGAAGIGAKVALIERHRMGGDCLNVGCVPSKALLEYTASYPQASFDDAFTWLRKIRSEIAPHDSIARYSEAGVDVFLGQAGFDDQGQLRVDDLVIKARRTVICTGASAAIPPIEGLRESDPLTNESVFDLDQRPESIGILGAGAIGCELALVFGRLGVEVHLFEMAPRVLPLEIPRASQAVAEALAEVGVTCHLGEGVSAVHGSRTDGYRVSVGSQQIEVAQVLVALGRKPNTQNLNLEAVGVELDERGMIQTDAKLRSSNSKIYAAGDCTAALQFTHHADAHARAVVQNALFFPSAKVDALVVPHCTYTQPEVASVGASEQALQDSGTEFDVYEFDFKELDRGRTEPHGEGFARVLTRKGSDAILGATIVGHDAGEQIAPLCILMSNGMGLAKAGNALFSYPTRSEYLKRLADAYNRTRMTPTIAGVFKTWLRLIR